LAGTVSLTDPQRDNAAQIVGEGGRWCVFPFYHFPLHLPSKKKNRGNRTAQTVESIVVWMSAYIPALSFSLALSNT